MRQRFFGMSFLALALVALMALAEPALAQGRGGGRMGGGGGGNCPAWQGGGAGGGQSRGWASRNQTQPPEAGVQNSQTLRPRQRQRLRDGSCLNNAGTTAPVPSQPAN